MPASIKTKIDQKISLLINNIRILRSQLHISNTVQNVYDEEMEKQGNTHSGYIFSDIADVWLSAFYLPLAQWDL